jgi:alpha-glucosidase
MFSYFFFSKWNNINSGRLLETKPTDTEAQNIARQEYQRKSRDNARTPVQWSAEPNAGFTGPNVKPWMSVNPEYTRVNAADQVKDPNSLYHYWASVLQLRKTYLDIFVYGNYALVDRASQEVYAYTRAYHTSKALVLANWTDRDLTWDAAAHKVDQFEQVLLDTYGSANAALGRFSGGQWTLRPFEAVVILLK